MKISSGLYFSLERGPLCSEEISWVWNLSSHMCSLQGIGNYKAESKYYLSPVFLEVWQFVHDSTHTLLSRDRTTAFKWANIWGKYEKGYIHFLGIQNLCRNWLQPRIGRTDAEAETLILWPSHVKSWLIGKDPDAGRDWRQEEKGMTEDGWMASPTQCTWVWVNSGSWWWTGRPGVVRFARSRIRLSNWTELNEFFSVCIKHVKQLSQSPNLSSRHL